MGCQRCAGVHEIEDFVFLSCLPSVLPVLSGSKVPSWPFHPAVTRFSALPITMSSILPPRIEGHPSTPLGNFAHDLTPFASLWFLKGLTDVLHERRILDYGRLWTNARTSIITYH